MTSDESGNNKKAGSSDVVRALAIACSGKRQAQSPMVHFEKLLEETCPNHAYPVKHKLRDYGMMKNFMASRSLTRGTKVNEVLDEGYTMRFLEEDATMMIHNGCSSPGMCLMSNLSLGTPTRCSWGCRNMVM
jgi:hypothetical protein